MGELAPLVIRQRSASPALWAATLGPLVAAVTVFSLLTWQTLRGEALTQLEAAGLVETVAPPQVLASAGTADVAQENRPEPPRAEVAAPDSPDEPGQPPSSGATPAPFVPVRVPETPAPAPTLEPTPVVTPGPFPPAATTPPTQILIPAIQVDAPVVSVGFYYVREGPYLVRYYEVAEYAAGWHEDSALPGAPGNTVIAGHNNVKGEVFRDLYKLEPGDMVYLNADGRWYPYRVVQKLLLREVGVPPEQQFENARWIAPTNDVRLTLVSCWPYETNTHRVIVVAVPDGTQ